MKLAKAASFFNRMRCLDGYSGQFLFNGQLGLYDDNKRDSETAERRVLSLTPDEVIPTRRVVQAAGSRWIVGHSNPDDFNGSTIRIGYTIQEAPLSSRVRTLQQMCLGHLGTLVFLGRAWVKDRAYAEQSSELVTQYHLHFSTSEDVRPQHLVTLEDNKAYVVRSVNQGAGGTLVALCDEMPYPSIETGQMLTGAYDPVTETISGTPDLCPVVRLHWQSIFKYQNPISPTFQSDDIQIAIAEAIVTVQPGARLTLFDGQWYIASATLHEGVWLCRATRNAG